MRFLYERGRNAGSRRRPGAMSDEIDPRSPLAHRVHVALDDEVTSGPTGTQLALRLLARVGLTVVDTADLADLRAECAALRTDNERLREVLGWYVDHVARVCCTRINDEDPMACLVVEPDTPDLWCQSCHWAAIDAALAPAPPGTRGELIKAHEPWCPAVREGHTDNCLCPPGTPGGDEPPTAPPVDDPEEPK